MLLCHIDVDLFVDLFTHHRRETGDLNPLLGVPFGVVAGWRRPKSDDRIRQRRMQMLGDVRSCLNSELRFVTYASRQYGCTCGFGANLGA